MDGPGMDLFIEGGGSVLGDFTFQNKCKVFVTLIILRIALNIK